MSHLSWFVCFLRFLSLLQWCDKDINVNLADSETAVRIVPLKCFIVYIIEDSILYTVIFLLCKTEIRTVNVMVRYRPIYFLFMYIIVFNKS